MSEEQQAEDREKIPIPDPPIEPPQDESAQSQILESSPEPLLMEVHHHGHVHETKKWKEYIFQFIMLFLAVFCGFLAEYELEHVIEHHREKQYIKSFAEDLRADSVYLQNRIDFVNRRIVMQDSLITLLNAVKKPDNANDIYFLARSIARYFPFNVNDRTIIQLRNAGGMRLIKNKEASDSIVGYYQRVDLIKYLDNRTIDGNDGLFPVYDKLLNGIDYGKLTDTVNNAILRVSTPLRLQSTDAATLNEAIIHLQRMTNLSISMKIALRDLVEREIRIREFILKAYHLD